MLTHLFFPLSVGNGDKWARRSAADKKNRDNKYTTEAKICVWKWKRQWKWKGKWKWRHWARCYICQRFPYGKVRRPSLLFYWNFNDARNVNFSSWSPRVRSEFRQPPFPFPSHLMSRQLSHPRWLSINVDHLNWGTSPLKALRKT